MESSSATARGYLLRHSSSSNHHFLNLISSSAVISGSDDFNESEVFWTADFGLSNQADLDRKQRIMPSNSGVLVALADDADFGQNNRIGSIVTRECSMAMGMRMYSSSSQSIPIQADCRKFQQSAPINVPKAMGKQRNNGEIVVGEEEEEEEEMLPPHEIVGRGSGVSPNTTFSVLEGIGRTLKGRDLRRVRNAVLRRTGLAEENQWDDDL